MLAKEVAGLLRRQENLWSVNPVPLYVCISGTHRRSESSKSSKAFGPCETLPWSLRICTFPVKNAAKFLERNLKTGCIRPIEKDHQAKRIVKRHTNDAEAAEGAATLKQGASMLPLRANARPTSILMNKNAWLAGF